MKNLEQEIEELKSQLAEKQKKLTLIKGVGVEAGQDGNVGAADAVTGNVDYEKQEQMSKKKMLISKMKMQG